MSGSQTASGRPPTGNVSHAESSTTTGRPAGKARPCSAVTSSVAPTQAHDSWRRTLCACAPPATSDLLATHWSSRAGCEKNLAKGSRRLSGSELERLLEMERRISATLQRITAPSISGCERSGSRGSQGSSSFSDGSDWSRWALDNIS